MTGFASCAMNTFSLLHVTAFIISEQPQHQHNKQLKKKSPNPFHKCAVGTHENSVSSP